MLRRLQPTERTMAQTNETSTNEADAVAGGAAPAANKKNGPDRKGKSETKRALKTTDGAGKAAEGKIKPKTKLVATAETKASVVLKKLKSPKGVTIEALKEATGWQAHSVRGFLSAVVKKKLGLNLVNEVGKDGVRRYRIEDAAKAK
ncbi:DUF3489 domain-containing protein [Mesorhizobium sp. KR9-304]|uniref:DUF3489 domain-containing protein n=1 Tax=Mesorhizobium sp. KR9-304 TaxID=3156614 RepID=UPI0032B39344